MTEVLRPDLCVLGGGTAGLAAATTAAGLGAEVTLVEKRAPGSCLGQVIASDAFSAAARDVSRAAKLGIRAEALRIDLKHLRGRL